MPLSPEFWEDPPRPPRLHRPRTRPKPVYFGTMYGKSLLEDVLREMVIAHEVAKRLRKLPTRFTLDGKPIDEQDFELVPEITIGNDWASIGHGDLVAAMTHALGGNRAAT